MADEVAEIKAEEVKEVAVIEAQQASDAEEANKFMETLDKLQEFKRFILALVLMGFFGLVLIMISMGIFVMMWRGQLDVAIEAAKWLMALLIALMGSVIGFYFGSNSAPSNPS